MAKAQWENERAMGYLRTHQQLHRESCETWKNEARVAPFQSNMHEPVRYKWGL